MHNFFIVLLSISSSVAVSAKVNEFDHKYRAFDSVLSSYVIKQDGMFRVNYKKLKQDHYSGDTRFRNVLISFESVSEKQFESFGKDQKLAFLINAYNAFVLRLIVDNYPTESIRKILKPGLGPFDIEFFNLLGAPHHLDWIENEMIRAQYKDPRINFALTRASIGSPDLLPFAYKPELLPIQLNEGMKSFLVSPRHVHFDAKFRRLYVSKVFEWFQADFIGWKIPKKHLGDIPESDLVVREIRDFIAQIAFKKGLEREQILSRDTDLRYFDFNWQLNETH